MVLQKRIALGTDKAPLCLEPSGLFLRLRAAVIADDYDRISAIDHELCL